MSTLIYGGTFDPPHIGHMNVCNAVQQYFSFEKIIFVPCKTPVLKKPSSASTSQRIAMLTLALQDHPTFKIDEREIMRDTPSFMVETLTSFREELGAEEAITLLVGRDAFITLPQWHEWEKILSLSHLLVVSRPQTPHELPETLRRLSEEHENSNPTCLTIKPCGNIYYFNAGNYDISSHWLREQIKSGEDVAVYLPEKVLKYIQLHQLYST